MHNNISESVVGCLGVAFGFMCLGYALSKRKQMENICNKIDISLDDISEKTNIDIPKDVINKAVDRAINREVEKAIITVKENVVSKVEKDILSAAENAVNDAYPDTSVAVKNKVNALINGMDIYSLRTEVRDKAKAEVISNLENNLDDILEDYKNSLSNVRKIYSSIADSMIPENGKRGQTVSFTI